MYANVIHWSWSTQTCWLAVVNWRYHLMLSWNAQTNLSITYIPIT